MLLGTYGKVILHLDKKVHTECILKFRAIGIWLLMLQILSCYNKVVTPLSKVI